MWLAVELVPWPHLFTPRGKCRSDHGVQGLRKTISPDMIQRVLRRERQKRCYARKRQGHMIEKYCHNILFHEFLWGKKRWRQEKTKEWSNLIIISFQNFPFWTYIKKSAHSLCDAWSFLLVHIWFTLSEGPKGFAN